MGVINGVVTRCRYEFVVGEDWSVSSGEGPYTIRDSYVSSCHISSEESLRDEESVRVVGGKSELC